MFVAQKSFLRKTRRGKIVKVVREHYLRDDIGCGVAACPECANEDNGIDVAASSPCPSIMARPHLIVPDASAFVGQMDVIDGGLSRVVVLQTVAEEVSRRSTPVYRRIRDAVADRGKSFFVFVNEHRRETYVERLPGETTADRNARAVAKACAWYKDHLSDAGVDVAMISDDAASRAEAKESGVDSFSVADYVRAMTESPLLLDKLSLQTEDGGGGDAGKKKFLFPEHLSPQQINLGIKAKTVFQGVFYLCRTNYLEATVNCEAFDEPVLLQGLEKQNRAVDGDHVAFALLPKSEWKAPAQLILEDEGPDPGDTLDEDKTIEDDDGKEGKAEDRQPTGRVVGIVKRKWRQYCGILQPSLMSGGTRHIFVPAEKKVPKIRIETRQSDRLRGQRIIVAVDAWPRHSRYPQVVWIYQI